MRKVIFFLLAFFLLASSTNTILAENSYDKYLSQQKATAQTPSNLTTGSDGNLYYDTNSYNIFTAPLWVVQPYVSFSYAFNVATIKNYRDQPYSNLDNLNHGFNIGAGVMINNNYGFGMSFNYLTKNNNYQLSTNNQIIVNGVRVNIMSLNFDALLKLPFKFKEFRTYFITGMNIVFQNLEHNFTGETVPVAAAQMNKGKTSFGFTLGLGLEYKIIEHLYFRFDFRRVFVINGIVKGNGYWLGNVGLVAQF